MILNLLMVYTLCLEKANLECVYLILVKWKPLALSLSGKKGGCSSRVPRAGDQGMGRGRMGQGAPGKCVWAVPQRVCGLSPILPLPGCRGVALEGLLDPPPLLGLPAPFRSTRTH